MAAFNQGDLTANQLLVLTAARYLISQNGQDGESLAIVYHQVGDEEAWEAAAANSLLPQVAHALRDPLGDRVPGRWSEAHASFQARNEAILGEWDRLSCLLGEAGVRVVAVEAGSLLAGLGACSGCFSSEDVDVLADPAQALTADRVLTEAGLVRGVQRWAVASSRQAYRMPLPGNSEFWLNIMWEPLSRRWLPPVERPEQQELLERSVPIPDRATCLRLPAPEDHLLLSALHASVHGYVRSPGLRLYLDLDQVARRCQPDWERTVAVAAEWGVRKRVSVALLLAAGLLGTPVPEWVPDRLMPDRSKRERLLAPLTRVGVFESAGPKLGPLELVQLELSLDDRGPAHGLLRILLPSWRWMRRRYGISFRWQLPYYYARRLGAIALAWRPFS